MRSHNLFKSGLMLVALMALLGISAAAQEYLILRAEYGTPARHADVTHRLRELARSDMRFRVANDVLGGDPAFGEKKILRIHARGPRGDVRTFEYTEGSWVDGVQFAGWRGGNWEEVSWRGGWSAEAPQDPRHDRDGDSGIYQILRAEYGTPDRHIDVTQRLRELARADIRFRMGNSTFGADPAPGVKKILRIYARDPRGDVRTFEYVEGSVVDGSQFTGWRGGNWGDNNWHGGWEAEHPHQDIGRDRDSGSYLILRAEYGTPRHNIDVTNRLKQLAHDDVRFQVSNGTFGADPDRGHQKTLRIITRGPQGEERVFEYREGSGVDGNMFIGWRTGNWGDGRR